MDECGMRNSRQSAYNDRPMLAILTRSIRSQTHVTSCLGSGTNTITLLPCDAYRAVRVIPFAEQNGAGITRCLLRKPCLPLFFYHRYTWGEFRQNEGDDGARIGRRERAHRNFTAMPDVPILLMILARRRRFFFFFIPAPSTIRS